MSDLTHHPDKPLINKKSAISLPVRIATVYVVFSLFWIYFSDLLLHSIIYDPDLLIQLQTYKGWAFVLISGGLIYLLTYLDLKARLRVENQLSEQTLRLKQVLNSVSHSIIQYTPDGRITYTNQAARQLYQFSSDALPDNLISICRSDNDFHLLTASLTAQAEKGQYTGQIRLTQKSADNTSFTALIDWSAIIQDKQVTGFIAAITDVSQQQREQQQLDQAALVFDMADEGYMITDARGEILNVNPSFSRITGFTQDQVIGRTPAIMRSGHHDKAFYEALWDQLIRTGHWQGELVNKKADGEDQHIWQKIYALRNQQGIVKKYVAVMYEISNLKQSGIDDLTQLPNLPQLRDRLTTLIPEARQKREFFCIAYIDLDNFQGINDSFGHQLGDQLVQEVARRLVACTGPEDIIARQGGDEFIILGRNLNPQTGSAQFADLLLKTFELPFEIQEQKLFITASIGLCCYPEDGENTDTLLRNADTALFRAKDTGKNNYQFYTRQLTSNAVQKMEVELDLRRAITEAPEELEVFYQPQINLVTGMVSSAEALVRWQHPDGKRIGPDEFIPAAENTGLIIPLGQHVLRQSCLDFLNWQREGLELERICVNVSAVQLLRSSFYEDTQAILQETGIPPEALELEVTETALMKDDETVAHVLAQLQDKGIQIAIDDFGTGYSSLGRLQSLPVDRLKIDRSFMPEDAQAHGDHALITSVLSLASNLNLEVVAEGVETEYQAELLIRNRCQLAQGYLYSPPLPNSAFVEWVRRHTEVMQF
ncbi:EAL domain-containing protein [Oceanospirillum sediminis]|uniref:EAL domain-containing protein n=1 Tax=Oceanospirillum sediminis TaxID=2760088 RepID=A0A839ILE5_9GAMM|nr:bifunctional diguanylate cyclase/phosphodiesterase [Oceanospirillum sediminis]MBB1485362.1 EAL domain-containing protein [Oceanospirillum sediminis]